MVRENRCYVMRLNIETIEEKNKYITRTLNQISSATCCPNIYRFDAAQTQTQTYISIIYIIWTIIDQSMSIKLSISISLPIVFLKHRINMYGMMMSPRRLINKSLYFLSFSSMKHLPTVDMDEFQMRVYKLYPHSIIRARRWNDL